MARKKKTKPPKVRRSWTINPKSRVTPSKKEYNRKKQGPRVRPGWADEELL